jgi:cell division topological specificity factor
MLSSYLTRKSKNSRSQAKQRLQFVLAFDRAALTEDEIETMHGEMVAVLSKYVELDTEHCAINLSARDGTTALNVNFPIRRIKPEATEIAAETAPALAGHTIPLIDVDMPDDAFFQRLLRLLQSSTIQ